VIWLAELHFDPARSILSSPMCIASAIASPTKRIGIGIGVQVLPLGNPLRIAEEAATVDQISHGRLIFAVGRRGVAKTYEAYNIPYAESKDRFNETHEIIQQAWSEPNFSHNGKYFRFQDATVTPRPFQQPMPAIRVAATSPDTFVAIGQQGKPIFLAVRHEDARLLAPQIASYRKAWRDARHRGEGKVYLRVPGYLAATKEAARVEYEASLMHYYRAQGALLADSARRAGMDGAEKRLKAAERLSTITYDEATRGTVLVRTADSVTDQIRGLQADLALDGILVEIDCGGKVRHEYEMETLRLLCQDVMPRFR
jgi:alkanesulfonate monooxygenase SsuD/methylene tetrahydromethanopterin reductase-like flavin-dependent oxidoreductase (luciferase family)